MNTLILIVILGLLAAWLLRGIGELRRQERSDELRAALAWKPPVLMDARLAYAEPKAMRIDEPVPLVAKVDRAYRTDEGLVLAEYKTRRAHRVYPADILELSAQRVVLQGWTREAVNDEAYVVTATVDERDRRTHPVRLLQPEEVFGIARRYQRLVNGEEAPRKANDPRKCRGCAYIEDCRPELQGEQRAGR